MDCSFECRKIYFMEGTVVNDCIVLVAEGFLIVECIMFYTHCNSVFLNFLYIRNYHFGSEVRVLTHVLEVTAVQRGTIDVHSRTKQDVLLAEACLFTDAFAIKSRHILIPCCCKGSQCWECNAGVICPASLPPLVPEHLRTDAMRSVGSPKLRDTKTRDAC